MRKLVFVINLTVDGCCDHTKGVPDAELHEYHRRLLIDSDTLLYGRKTFQLMVPYWPDIANRSEEVEASSRNFAVAFQSVKEIVVISRTLKTGNDDRTRIIHGDLPNRIIKLKEQPGGTILTGGVELPLQLIRLGLVDEMHVLIQPRLAGKGRRLFDDLELPQDLTLIDQRVFSSGTTALRYNTQVSAPAPLSPQ